MDKNEKVTLNTTCEGYWTHVPTPADGENEIQALRCSVCREWWIVIKGQSFSRSPRFDLESAVRQSMQEYFANNQEKTNVQQGAC